MARHPDWFERLDAITEVVREANGLEWIGRKEMQAIFASSERDSIRLLHKFGAEERADALMLPRTSLLAQLEAIRAGSTYAAFRAQRGQLARQLRAARAETVARHFRVAPAPVEEAAPGLDTLPPTVRWRRLQPAGPAHFEILYDDGADLMWQLAEFLAAAGRNREHFYAGTEPADEPGQ